MRAIFTFLLTVLSCFSTGCGGGPISDLVGQAGEHAGSNSQSETPGFVAQRPEKSYQHPGETVNDFLVAVKSGEDELATALLTTLAQEEAWTNGLAISGEGFPAAKFDISEVEFLKENTEAHVLSVWSDRTYGQRKSFECVWLLRREQHGWCIYGMATKFLEELPPVILNFENQAEMQQRQRWAQQQIVKHQQLELEQQQAKAQGPQRPDVIQQATRPKTTILK